MEGVLLDLVLVVAARLVLLVADVAQALSVDRIGGLVHAYVIGVGEEESRLDVLLHVESDGGAAMDGGDEVVDGAALKRAGWSAVHPLPVTGVHQPADRRLDLLLPVEGHVSDPVGVGLHHARAVHRRPLPHGLRVEEVLVGVLGASALHLFYALRDHGLLRDADSCGLHHGVFVLNANSVPQGDEEDELVQGARDRVPVIVVDVHLPPAAVHVPVEGDEVVVVSPRLGGAHVPAGVVAPAGGGPGGVPVVGRHPEIESVLVEHLAHVVQALAVDLARRLVHHHVVHDESVAPVPHHAARLSQLGHVHEVVQGPADPRAVQVVRVHGLASADLLDVPQHGLRHVTHAAVVGHSVL